MAIGRKSHKHGTGGTARSLNPGLTYDATDGQKPSLFDCYLMMPSSAIPEVLNPDLEQSRRFLTLLDDGTDAFTFQTFDDSKAKRTNLALYRHGDFDSLADWLTEQNRLGAGIFVTINKTDGFGRRGPNIQRVRAVFVDLDDPCTATSSVERAMRELEPHIICETSPGKRHVLWLVDGLPLKSFKVWQKYLAIRFGGDPNVCDLPRVMRLPGFWHCKREPFLSRMLHESLRAPYSVVDLVAAFGEPTVTSPHAGQWTGATFDRGAILDGHRNTALASLAGTMRRKGMTESAIKAALLVENATRCRPPLHEAEVTAIAYSVSRYAPGDDVADLPRRYTRKELVELIEAEDDFDILTGHFAGKVHQSALRASEKESLLKLIRKKTGVSLKSLREDAKLYGEVQVEKGFEHLRAARDVVKSYGMDNLIGAMGAVWRWDGKGVWRILDDREIKQRIHKVAESNQLTKAIVDSILDLVKTEVFQPNHRFDIETRSINCLNGELWFERGKWILKPHVRKHYRTTQIPVKYDPNAQAPRFCRFLKEIFAGDIDADDKARIVLELMGYSLLASCEYEKFGLLIGSGANGKSVLLSVMEKLAGRENVAGVQPSQFDNKFQRAHLHGKLVNIVMEIAEGAEIADAQLKAIVSGELTTAEHKFRDPFEFQPFATCWFGTNHMPHTRDFSDALFRRAIILTFNNKFEGTNCDPLLKTKLETELPGILNLALAALSGVIQRGQFSECDSGRTVKAEWRMQCDQVAQFIQECCVLEGMSKSTELYARYTKWASENGIKRTLGRNSFSARLFRLGAKPHKGTAGGRYISGIRLRLSYEDAA